MSWKKLFKPVEMPDKNDPKYRETYKEQVAAGEKFAEVLGIKKLAGYLQSWGSSNKKLFLGLAFGFVILLFILNVIRIARVVNRPERKAIAVERVDQALQQRKENKNVKPLTPVDYDVANEN